MEQLERRPMAADDPARQERIIQLKNEARQFHAGRKRCLTCGGPATRQLGAPGSAAAKAYCAIDAQVEIQKLERAWMSPSARLRMSATARLR